MEELARNLYYIGILFYFEAFLLFALSREKKIGKKIQAVILTGFVIHSIGLLLYIWLCGYIPIHKRTQNTIVRTWGMGVILNYISWKYREKLISAVFILTIIMVFVSGLPFTLASEMVIKDVFIGLPPFLWFHLYDTSFVIFSYCFSLSIVMLILIGKGKEPKGLCKRIQNCALWGFVIFTLSQIAGSVWAMIDFGDYWHWKPMHLLSVATWVFYGAMVHLKWIKGFSKKVLPVMGIIGFAGIFWWTIYHDYGKQIVGFFKGVLT